jgi:hypothetical protein
MFSAAGSREHKFGQDTTHLRRLRIGSGKNSGQKNNSHPDGKMFDNLAHINYPLLFNIFTSNAGCLTGRIFYRSISEAIKSAWFLSSLRWYYRPLAEAVKVSIASPMEKQI